MPRSSPPVYPTPYAVIRPDNRVNEVVVGRFQLIPIPGTRTFLWLDTGTGDCRMIDTATGNVTLAPTFANPGVD